MDNNTHNGGSIRRSKRKASSEALKEIRKITRPARASSNGAIQEGESLLNLVLRFCPIFDPSNLCDTRHTIEALFGSVNDLYEVLCTKNTSMTHQIPIELAKAKLIYIALQKMDDEITGLVKARISGLINSITMPSTLSLFHRAVTLFILLQVGFLVRFDNIVAGAAGGKTVSHL
ncbi:hypothetical protein EV182_002163 [Spiromyces aspiralis]|uniref:Uncharacterized protein n=1 Tax=Spiromyces aspiralis TaxID=68401 RepID=A0ACC1HH65_9FUNG|nr:hypothetical protein EV182_002163 [Spiromyces aspiralis]